MCGLFGVVLSNPPRKAHLGRVVRLFNSLAVCSVTRGDHATGVAVVQRSGKTPIYENSLPAPVIVDTRSWQNALKRVGTDTAALLGHTRHGTHGDNVPGNAHPFVFQHETYGELVGVHNGMILNHDELLEGTAGQFESDSANLFHALASLPENQFAKLLAKVWGSFALVFRRGNQLYFVRNSASPLYVCRAPTLEVLLYASEAQILRKAARVHSVKITTPAEINHNRLYALDITTYKERTLEFTPEDENISLDRLLRVDAPKQKAIKWHV